MMRQSEDEYQDKNKNIDNFVDPLYNKNASDYDDDFEICINTSNENNLNKELHFKSNQTFSTEYLMSHTSKQKYVSNISKSFMYMHDHTNEQHYGIIKILQVSNLENNIKALKSLHKNYLNIEVQSTNNNLNHEFSNGINNTCEKSEIQKKKTFFINAWTKMFFLMW
jgi:hypothetical protein